MGDEQVQTDRERSRKWESNREEQIYRSLVKLDRCRYREVSRQLSRKVSRKWSLTDTGMEEVSMNNPPKARTDARFIHQLSRSYRGGRSFLNLSIRYWEAVGNTIRKSWRSSTNSKVSRTCNSTNDPINMNMYWGHECNPTCNSTNYPINILSSQNHLSIKILSTWISKTHTHTH